MASATPDVDNAQMYPVDDIKITNWICIPVSHSAALITSSRTHDGLYGHESGHDITQILSESRSVRVVLYGSTPVESEHRFWVDPEVTFGGVAKALAEMYPSQELVVLQANWGPRPYWTESHPDSPIGSTCRVLYAILKDQAKPYTMGVVRTSLSDYPIPIYVPASKSSMTLLEAVIASYPKLTGQVKSIVIHFGGHDLQDDPWDNEFPQVQPYPTAPLFITTLDEPSKEFLAGSFYEDFSPSSPKASTVGPSVPVGVCPSNRTQSSDSDELIPPLLQISFAECKLLVQRAYDLDEFPLQMIHLSEAIFHVVISLARGLTPVFEGNSSSIGDALSTDDDLADHLRVAPLLCRQLEELLDAANNIMDNLELGSFNKEGAQHAMETIFAALCGDLPGAVIVRCSENDFKKFGSIDCQELDTLEIDTHVKSVKTEYPEFIIEDGRVVNLDPMMDLDYPSDVEDLPDLTSEPGWLFSSRKGGISEDNTLLGTIFTDASSSPNPALRRLLDNILASDFLNDQLQEPLLTQAAGRSMVRELSGIAGYSQICLRRGDQSLYTLFVEQKNNKCLFCGSYKGVLSRAVGCVRKHLGHRPFVCDGSSCELCDKRSDAPARFYMSSLLKDHIKSRTEKISCVHEDCPGMLRRGNMHRHWEAMHAGTPFPYHVYNRYTRIESTTGSISMSSESSFSRYTASLDVTANPMPNVYGDLLQQPFKSTFSKSIPINHQMAPVYQPYYQPHAYDSLADQFPTQDVTRNHELRRDWSHSDLDPENLGLDTQNNLEQTSTPLNRSVNDSNRQLPPIRYHDFHAESMIDNPAMVRVQPSPCLLRPIWEGHHAG